MTAESRSCELRVGDRIQYAGNRGTIRYIGTVAGHGATQWAGVEWDDSARGKHSGAHNGRTYFVCAPGAGSFIKLDKLGRGGRKSLLECVQKRYMEDAFDETFRKSMVVVGGGLVSIEDSNEKRQREAVLAEPQVLDVSGMGLARLKEAGMQKFLSNVRELRIGRSLFSGIGYILQALEIIPMLQVLDASRNVLEEDDSGIVLEDGDAGELKLAENLREVILNHCVVSWKTVGKVCERSRKLQILRLHNCMLGKIDSNIHLTHNLLTLQTLDLDGNQLQWDDVTQYIGKLENLKEVYLSNNELRDTGLPTNGCMAKVEVLSLAHNAIDGWKVITWLHSLPRLRNLRIRGNPVTSEDKEESEKRLTWRMRVIGRIGQLQVLDGSAVSVDERLLCEKRYTSEEITRAWQADETAARREHPRAEELGRTYGLGMAVGEGVGMRGDMVRVKLIAGKAVKSRRDFIVRNMPKGAGMSRVRAVGRRLLGISGDCRIGVVVDNDIEWEDDLSQPLSFWNNSHSELCVVIAAANRT